MLIVAGIGVMAIGYAEPTTMAVVLDLYAYVSVMAIGAMITIVRFFLSRDESLRRLIPSAMAERNALLLELRRHFRMM